MKDVFTFVVHISCKESQAVQLSSKYTFLLLDCDVQSENVLLQKFNRREHWEVTFVAMFAQTWLSPSLCDGGQKYKNWPKLDLDIYISELLSSLRNVSWERCK